MVYAEVILPLPLKDTFTYALPPALEQHVRQGHRVLVPFGRSKYYTGIVSSVTPVAPKGFEVKEIIDVMDDTPVLRNPQLRLWQWMADYYMCPIGDVYKAALPAALKLESETFVELNDEYEEAPGQTLSDHEALVVQVLDHEGTHLRVSEIAKKSGLKRVNAVISRLLEKGAVIISERLVEKYRTKQEVYVKPTEMLATAEGRTEAFAAVKNAKKQEMALLGLLQLSGQEQGEIPRRMLCEKADVTPPIVESLRQKGLVEVYRKAVNRFMYNGAPATSLPTLTEEQQRALSEIHASGLDKAITLLHGITSSGKTEIYIHLIDYVLREGKQVLLLVPEIALTTQLTHRMQRVFAERVIIYHSKFSDNERVDIWRRMLDMKGEGALIIAPRSGIFLPFDRLGLVIVDEEHDSSYKQSEPAPRYQGRDTATVLASLHGAKTLLGTATPSVETYYKALTGRFGLVTLNERYSQMPLPEIRLIDMKRERQKLPKGAPPLSLAPQTKELIQSSLANKHQAIVFINRRGYAPMAVCRMCGYIPKCERCDVSLTYHRGIDKLVCHYCGAKYALPAVCPACHDHTIDVVGFGTERIEEETQAAFPEARLARLDLDTTRAKDAYSAIIDDFAARRKDILIGTQMVSKGLDFDEVTTVAVVNADSVLHYPDFRAHERAFNMIEQVAGRAGRKLPGAVVAVQTMDVGNPVMQQIVTHDYSGFYNTEIAERQEFGYPPFTRMIYIYLKHPDRRALEHLATTLGNHLRALLGGRVTGPEEPPVGKVQLLYIQRIMVKLEPAVSLTKAKTVLLDAQTALVTLPEMRAARIYYDVDP